MATWNEVTEVVAKGGKTVQLLKTRVDDVVRLVVAKKDRNANYWVNSFDKRARAEWHLARLGAGWEIRMWGGNFVLVKTEAA